jgi:hypothetical protein
MHRPGTDDEKLAGFALCNYCKLFLKKCEHSTVFLEKRQLFRRKLAKIDENWDLNIDPRDEFLQNFISAENFFDKFPPKKQHMCNNLLSVLWKIILYLKVF